MLHACFYTIFLVFHYTSWHFYAFSETNLLMRCHSTSFLFSAIYKLHRKYFRIGRNKSQTSRNLPKLLENRRGDGVGPRGAHTTGWHGPGPGHAPLCVRPPWSTSDDAPSPIKTPWREKPKHLINFLETHRDPPPSSTRDREGPEALPGTLPERGITTEGLLHRHASLRRNEWVVYLGLWVHSSS
jgi:hypothetical protein